MVYSVIKQNPKGIIFLAPFKPANIAHFHDLLLFYAPLTRLYVVSKYKTSPSLKNNYFDFELTSTKSYGNKSISYDHGSLLKSHSFSTKYFLRSLNES